MSEAVHIVCPHCDAVNRLPVDRLADQGSCGKCKRPLFTGQPLELDPGRFAIHARHSGIPLVIDFWAPWCGPCRMMAPAFAAAAAKIETRARLVKINTEAHPDIGGQFGIRSIPTLVVMRDGAEIARQSGAMDAASLQRWITAQITR